MYSPGRIASPSSSKATKIVNVGYTFPTTINLANNINAQESERQNSSSTPTSGQTLTGEGVPELSLKKLSVGERLGRLSRYRIRPTTLRSTAKPTETGGYADVSQANFKRNKKSRSKRVAVKKLRCSEKGDKKSSIEFVHEVEMLAALSHENIVKLIGFVEDLKHQKAWLVLSWEPNGNVRKFLAAGNWEIPERISLIKDTFAGLNYLHTRRPPICHGDLKSYNILVSASYRAIITDFGSARAVGDNVKKDSDQEIVQDPKIVLGADQNIAYPCVTIIPSANQWTLTGPAWSLRWAAPEVVKGEVDPGLPSDIWSAGWVCWEIMTDKLPFPDVYLEGPLTWRVIHGIVPSTRDEAQLSQITSLSKLMTGCWAAMPTDRPNVYQCSDEVKWMPARLPLGRVPPPTKSSSFKLLVETGKIHYSQGSCQKATTLFQRALAVAESTSNLGQIAEALGWLGDLDRLNHKYAEAAEFFIRAQDIYLQIGNDPGRAGMLWGLGDTYRLQHQYTKALKSFTRAQDIFARIGDDEGHASTLRAFGDVHCALRQYVDAEHLFLRAHSIYARIGRDHGQAGTLAALGDVYLLQSKYTEAEDSFTQAQRIYTRIGDDYGRATTLRGLGDVQSARCKYKDAERSYSRAQDIYACISNKNGQANSLDGLGDVYLAQSRYHDAEESFNRALDIHCRVGNHQGRADMLWGLGDVYRLQCRYAEAVESFTRAQEIYQGIGNEAGRASTLRGLGDTHYARAQYTAARESFLQARAIYIRFHDEQGEANTLRGLGYVYLAQSQYSEAEQSFIRAQNIYSRISDDHGRANALMGLGEIHCPLFKYSEAEECFNQAQDIYICIGDEQGRANTLRGLGEVYNARSKFDEALKYYCKAQEIYSRIGDHSGNVRVLCGLGHLRRSNGHDVEAAICYGRARDLLAQIIWAENERCATNF